MRFDKSVVKQNPFDFVGETQILTWSSLAVGDTIEVELINYFKAVSYKYGNSGYTQYAAIVIEDSKNSKLSKDSFVSLSFQYH